MSYVPIYKHKILYFLFAQLYKILLHKPDINRGVFSVTPKWRTSVSSYHPIHPWYNFIQLTTHPSHHPTQYSSIYSYYSTNSSLFNRPTIHPHPSDSSSYLSNQPVSQPPYSILILPSIHPFKLTTNTSSISAIQFFILSFKLSSPAMSTLIGLCRYRNITQATTCCRFTIHISFFFTWLKYTCSLLSNNFFHIRSILFVYHPDK